MDRKFITERRYSILIHGHIELINIRNYMKNKYTIVRSGGGCLLNNSTLILESEVADI